VEIEIAGSTLGLENARLGGHCSSTRREPRSANRGRKDRITIPNKVPERYLCTPRGLSNLQQAAVRTQTEVEGASVSR
jgi:hypothetical protein